MEVPQTGLEDWVVLHWSVAGVALCGLAAAIVLLRRARRLTAKRREGRRAKAELEAYARLEVRVAEDGNLQPLARRICQLVSQVSMFGRVAMLTQDGDGRLRVVASVGMETAILSALDAWGEQAMPIGPRLSRRMGGERERDAGSARMRAGVRDPAAVKPWTRRFPIELAHQEIRMVPLWTTAGRMIGALAVQVDIAGANGGETAAGTDAGGTAAGGTGAIEALAAKLARTLENASLAERLVRSEKLAGLGQLAGGVAHALNNPLTAVMGFAELIAETADEPHVQEDAATILREATRMRETVQSLLDLWRPARLIDEAVSLTALVRELAAACEEKLCARNVQLVLEMGDQAAEVRGSKERLRQVMEHLLNNAAQAIAVVANSDIGNSDTDPTCAQHHHYIRVTVRQDERGVQVIVSDSGPGFMEPTRVFDPFYTAQHPEQGAGLGLSICYGVVREHGGEISAYNLYPRGAAVVVELPVTTVGSCELVAGSGVLAS